MDTVNKYLLSEMGKVNKYTFFLTFSFKPHNSYRSVNFLVMYSKSNGCRKMCKHCTTC